MKTTGPSSSGAEGYLSHQAVKVVHPPISLYHRTSCVCVCVLAPDTHTHTARKCTFAPAGKANI